MPKQIFSQFLFIVRLLVYSAIASSVIKYIVPNWSLFVGLSNDAINVIAIYVITLPVALFAFVLWVKR